MTYLMRWKKPAPIIVIAAEANRMVTKGGDRLDDLREEVYDLAFNSICKARAGLNGVYDIALMGGEPYAIWY